MARQLTPRQRRFADEYLIDLNATQAAIRAGYSAKTANEQVGRLLVNVGVASEIARMKAERSRRTGVNQDRVLLELAKIGLADIADVVDLSEAAIRENLSRSDTAAIASVKVRRTPTESGDIIEREVRMCDKTKALVELGKHLGMFDSRVRIDGIMGVTFEGEKDLE